MNFNGSGLLWAIVAILIIACALVYLGVITVN